MHSKNLFIHSASLNNRQAQNISNIPLQFEHLHEMLHIELPSIIAQGEMVLSIAFSGSMDKKLVGFYASSLKNGG